MMRQPLAVPLHCPHCATCGTLDIAETLTLSETFTFDCWHVPTCAACNKPAVVGTAGVRSLTNEELIWLLKMAVHKAPQEAKANMARRDHERSEKMMAICLANYLQQRGIEITAPPPREYRHPPCR